MPRAPVNPKVQVTSSCRAPIDVASLTVSELRNSSSSGPAGSATYEDINLAAGTIVDPNSLLQAPITLSTDKYFTVTIDCRQFLYPREMARVFIPISNLDFADYISLDTYLAVRADTTNRMVAGLAITSDPLNLADGTGWWHGISAENVATNAYDCWTKYIAEPVPAVGSGTTNAPLQICNLQWGLGSNNVGKARIQTSLIDANTYDWVFNSGSIVDNTTTILSGTVYLAVLFSFRGIAPAGVQTFEVKAGYSYINVSLL